MSLVILGVVFSALVWVQATVTSRRAFYAVGLTAHLFNVVAQLLAGNAWLLPFVLASLVQTIWGWTVMEAGWKRLQRPMAMGIFAIVISLAALGAAIAMGAEEHIPHMRWLAVTVFCSALSYVAPNIAAVKSLQLVATAPWPVVYALSGVPASGLGDAGKLLLLSWSLFEIAHARKRDVNYDAIEKALLPWRIRKLAGKTDTQPNERIEP